MISNNFGLRRFNFKPVYWHNLSVAVVMHFAYDENNSKNSKIVVKMFRKPASV